MTSPSRTDAPLPAPPLLSGRNVLFLDFDGTLVEIASRPDRVVVDGQLPHTLDALAGRLGGAVAIVTGRWLADIDGLLASVTLPGAEVRDAGGASTPVRPVDGIAELVSALRERFGVKVGDGPTRGRYRCASVADVRAWLQASAAAS